MDGNEGSGEAVPLMPGRSSNDSKRLLPRGMRGGAVLPPRAAERARRARRHTREGRGAGPQDGYESDVEVVVAGEQRLRHRWAPPRKRVTLRRWLYVAMNGNATTPAATVFKSLLALVILFNVVVFMLSTLPELMDKYQAFFDWEEAAVSSLFLLEYVTRLWTCVESHKYCGCTGRLRYMLRYSSICDALATFPFFLETAISLVFPNAKLPNTTVVRMFSIFRVLKTERYLSSFESVGRVLYFNREILATSLVFSGLLVIMTATALYYADREQFLSIPASLYTALGMLTGSGAPERVDTVPLRIICSISSVFSVALCAIPAAMLAWGFEAEAEKRIESRRETMKARMMAERAGVPFDEEDAFTSESSQSSWEEFASEEEEMEGLEGMRSEVAAVRGVLTGMEAALAQLATEVAELKAHQSGAISQSPSQQ